MGDGTEEFEKLSLSAEEEERVIEDEVFERVEEKIKYSFFDWKDVARSTINLVE